MKSLLTRLVTLAACALLANCANGVIARTNSAQASASDIARDSRSALDGLFRTHPKARSLAARSRAVLVFPKVTKAGLMVGGMGGNGTLFLRGGGVGGFYQTAGLSYGLQAGAQQYGYALFLMNDQAVANLNRDGGWDIGSAPSIVVIDQGMAGSLTMESLNQNAYALFFSQKGLMAGLGLQGTKITRIHPRN
ncbi:MAG: lipid-binding SYLF domain-containing protein [Verrucomicrobiae bacterium]|nr:lipid-binding SYLF domain-containing protein [Verrucomicrobiae bacterium]